jgi:capsular exopolysaccharide synthesis family protein
MSHFRRIFNPTSESQQVSSEAPVSVAPNETAAAPQVAPAVSPTPEFPIEEAHLTPEIRLAFHDDPGSPAADRFRRLRMHLKTHWSAGKLKKLLVTGALPHDGKSTVILNLATALAERGKRKVLVVEADLHHPCLAQSLSLKPWTGLAQCIEHASHPLSAIRRISPLGWHLLAAGESRRAPTDLLQTPALGQIMHTLVPHFDWLLVDSPPVIPLSDSISLQQHTDATLLVVRAGQTPRDAVEQTIALLGQQHIVGIVLNGVEAREAPYYQFQYRYGGKNWQNSAL